MTFWVWCGVAISLLHSALFSGLNLGFFGVSRLRLELLAEAGNEDARRILNLRKDAHYLLSTILWANVASNVMIALLTDSVMSGVYAFILSTFGITLFGEIFPQAYLAKNVLKMSFMVVPIVRFYQTLLYPIARPTALLLDLWLGKEKILYFNEKEIVIMLKRQAQSKITDVGGLESLGAMNFLALDDVKVKDAGEVINPRSIITLPVSENGQPIFPSFSQDANDPFLQTIQASREKWVIITDSLKNPVLVINADLFLRDVAYEEEIKSILTYSHRPIVVTTPETVLGEVIFKFKVHAESSEDDVIDDDLILYWAEQKRIITGADILGRLLRGIVNRQESSSGA